jgi:hypothetical protein
MQPLAGSTSQGSCCPPCLRHQSSIVLSHCYGSSQVLSVKRTPGGGPGGQSAPLPYRSRECMCVLLLYLLHMQKHSSAYGGGPGGQSAPLPYRSRECMCVLLMYLLHNAAAQQYWWRGSGGAAKPPASQVQQVYVCAADVPLAQCSSTTVLVAGVKGGSQPPCLTDPATECVCAAAVSLARAAAQQDWWPRGTASPPALQVHVILLNNTMLIFVLGITRETTIFQSPMVDDHPIITIITRSARGHATVCAKQRATLLSFLC